MAKASYAIQEKSIFTSPRARADPPVNSWPRNASIGWETLMDAAVRGRWVISLLACLTPTFGAKDEATQAVYERLLNSDGWLLGCGELSAPPQPRTFFDTAYANQMARWQNLYTEPRLPAVYEFEMAQANQRRERRDWPAVDAFAARGGLPWMMLSLNNFTVELGGRQGNRVVGGMTDTTGGLGPVLPGGSARDAYVAYLTTFAREVKACGRPVVLRFLHEMNGRWFWWGGQPEAYRQVWRDAVALFEAESVTNVLWCWSPAADAGRLADYYPGDDVVDILGTSNYFDGPALPARIRTGLDELATLGEGKPIWLSEFGPVARLDFWRDALQTLATIDRLRGFNLWLARGWRIWGNDPERGSLIDEQTPEDVRKAFFAALDSPQVLTLSEWARTAP